ncbi:RraA family protein [Caballeronia insecticola]|uniref:Putative 4-hydroxy-4-methyl-2-oxoglutarate aldolase n=1 Tax=Caballeronia insecticola TaxID=758793 RepID=A0A060PKP5_9BURK|nr:RraA family protein [Caballeronia insecticola]BAO94141.1 dimethylmenaquinone methyltransferase [Caballeronia insecticola]
MSAVQNRAGWPAGFFIGDRACVPSAAQVEAFRTVPVAHAGDCMGRSVGAMGLSAYHHSLSLTMCGPALTVRVRPGDNMMIHKAIEMAGPGDVIVVDGGGDLTQALIGGLMRTSALTKKIGGFVIDGAIRDLAEWAEGVIPVYARGHTFRGPSKEGPGEVNVPISCAGMVVTPGDLVLGDADGVIAIPACQLDALLPLVRAHADKEAGIRATNLAGTADPERFNALLRKKGCPV